MRAFIFPGQGCQKQGMGKELYDHVSEARDLFERANSFCGRRITDVMFFGSELDLLETRNTQPAVFLYEVVASLAQKHVGPDVVAGHSLGEFAALVVNGCLSYEDGLNLVLQRAVIGQKACEKCDTTMGAVIGLPDEYVEARVRDIAAEAGEPVYVANYNGPGQVVITGTKNGVRIACKALKLEGAKKAVPLAIGGSFHSPFMQDAETELGYIIRNTEFRTPTCPIYQSVDGRAHTSPQEIQDNLVVHITHSVQWTRMVNNMVADGVTEFIEVGTDDTLQKIVRRMHPDARVQSIAHIPPYEGVVKDYSI